MFGTPVYRWLPAKSKIEFLLFYARVPEGFQHVDDVRLENGRIVIQDRRAQRQITLSASRGL
jgi:thymidylate kinase